MGPEISFELKRHSNYRGSSYGDSVVIVLSFPVFSDYYIPHISFIFRYYLMALAFLTKVISILFMVLSIKFYRLPKENTNQQDQDEPNENVELI